MNIDACSEKIDRLKTSGKKLLLMGFIFMLPCAYLFSCSDQGKPPYFTAEVINVYNEKTVVENFSLLYTWQERGETPFLKPYTYHAKEIIGECMMPFKDDPSRVTVATERIAFENIKHIDTVLTEAGKIIKVTTAEGREIIMTNNFPKLLKKDGKAGLADNKNYAEGYVMAGAQKKAFQLEFDYIKKIIIVKSSMQQ